MKAAFDAIGVDRNTIARTAIIAELHLAAPDVLKSMGQWNDKTETLSTFIGRCRSALTTEIKEIKYSNESRWSAIAWFICFFKLFCCVEIDRF